MAKRTVMRSSKGKKLYAVRDKKGQFKDIQQYSRAHAQDIKRGSKAEKKAAKKQATKQRADQADGAQGDVGRPQGGQARRARGQARSEARHDLARGKPHWQGARRI